MHPKTHAKLMNMYYYFGLLVGIPTFFIVIIIAILWKPLIPLLAFFIITAILNIFFGVYRFGVKNFAAITGWK